MDDKGNVFAFHLINAWYNKVQMYNTWVLLFIMTMLNLHFKLAVCTKCALLRWGSNPQPSGVLRPVP